MRNFTGTTVAIAQHSRTASLASQLKKLVFGIMLMVVGAALPFNTIAANISNINRAAAMEKQRTLNKTNLSKIRHFDKKPMNARSLKLDALPPSPRRGANPASTDLLLPVSAKNHTKASKSALQ